MTRSGVPVWLAAVALSALACASTTEAPEGDVIVTETEYPHLEPGPGAEYCAQLDWVRTAMQQQDWDRALGLIDTMTGAFEAYAHAQGGEPLSVANTAEWEQMSAAADPVNRVRVDWCYRELLHRRAFIFAALEEFDDALAALDEEERAAPTSPLAHTERGYVMNQLGRPADARACYERALALIERNPTYAKEKPTALRGLGYALIELGDLDAAEEAFAQSLVLEPGNALAISELEYIQKIRAGR